MKYDECKIAESNNYPNDFVVAGKIGKKRRVNVLDILLVPAVCGALVSATIMVSKLISSGLLSSVSKLFAG